MGTTDRISFDTGASAGVQGDIGTLIGQIESVMGQRDAQVAAAMSDFQADGVSEEYQAVELRWKNAASEVRNIIALVKSTLAENDSTASSAQARARAAVQNIG
ncbi:hypothetical protein BCF74_10333 [Knoellia remsis]|uniref:WXG100 family type VII secretion target n=1 Tax=Knoellia remsis TaxID=407159 RepID=A0A2T0UY26_9MICO|nr:pore-forming ESAT-6 family protein [Knoellia remsis]PRY62826.1 hypothetical protein BCF74_10333 [Knoellia remsis]